jgi:hypothetical protein
MCLSWTPVNSLVVVDTSIKIVMMSFNAVLDVTGGLDGESNSVNLPLVFVVRLDVNHKAASCMHVGIIMMTICRPSSRRSQLNSRRPQLNMKRC